MHSDSCTHEIHPFPHTTETGRVIPMTSCCKCGMEWTKEK